jgi:hypothetical protein
MYTNITPTSQRDFGGGRDDQTVSKFQYAIVQVFAVELAFKEQALYQLFVAFRVPMFCDAQNIEAICRCNFERESDLFPVGAAAFVDQ